MDLEALTDATNAMRDMVGHADAVARSHVRRVARPVGPGDRLAVHRADHPAPARDQHLPADLDRLSVVHELQANRPNAALDEVGLDNYRDILTDPDIWQAMQATAHFVFWSILLQMVLGFGLALLIDRGSAATASGPPSSCCR